VTLGAGRFRRCFHWLVLLFVVAVSPVLAQNAVVQLDPTKSTVDFSVSDVLHTVHGQFRLKSGTVTFDPVTGKASGVVVIDAASGNTGNESRDRKMHREVLESQKYPEITFRPSHLEGTVAAQGDSQVALTGVINLHGQDHEIIMQARVHIEGTDVSTDVDFPVPYVKWGLKNPSTFILRVSGTVQVQMRAAGQIMMPIPN